MGWAILIHGSDFFPTPTWYVPYYPPPRSRGRACPARGFPVSNFWRVSTQAEQSPAPTDRLTHQRPANPQLYLPLIHRCHFNVYVILFVFYIQFVQFVVYMVCKLLIYFDCCPSPLPLFSHANFFHEKKLVSFPSRQNSLSKIRNPFKTSPYPAYVLYFISYNIQYVFCNVLKESRFISSIVFLCL